MDRQARRCTKLSLAVCLIINLVALPTRAQELAANEQKYFEPTLIGYRFEGQQEFTIDGIAIVEANSPIKLTLFGELFNTDTIVGFTTEFAQHQEEEQQQQQLEDERNQQRSARHGDLGAPGDLSTLFKPPPAPSQNNRHQAYLNYRSVRADNDSAAGNNTNKLVESKNLLRPSSRKQTEVDINERRFKRRLLDRRSYDCTDHDRIISYKLTESNLITPNVAVLTVQLPELELGSESLGMYYYFCLKQPPILRAHQWPDEAAAASSSPSAAAERQLQGHNSSANKALAQNKTLVWVHQGDEWWLTIKVEPKMLSIANDCFLMVLLLFLSAVSSGLNLGLMSLDMNELAVISSCGDPRERSYARTIAPLRKRGNYLLCSLLLGNVMVNSTLTVILEEMTSGLVAVIGSTLAIVILGEIVPQAFCARRGLAIGAKTIYLTYAFMIITFPLSFPIACLLDCVLGEEKGNVYDRERLMEFIRITGNHTQLEADEVAIISGALKLKKIKVDQIMTKIEDVFMLPIECMLDRKTIRSIIEKGYSRIPIYELGDRKQIVALILAKDLALLDPDDQMPLANMLKYCKHPLVFIDDTATLDVALNEFKTGKSHMAIVRELYDDGEMDKRYEAIGVVTLEDVIEEVLQTEINDETDTLSDNRRKRRRTEAQVAHLVDELITTTTAAAAAATNVAAVAAAAAPPGKLTGSLVPPGSKF